MQLLAWGGAPFWGRHAPKTPKSHPLPRQESDSRGGDVPRSESCFFHGSFLSFTGEKHIRLLPLSLSLHYLPPSPPTLSLQHLSAFTASFDPSDELRKLLAHCLVVRLYMYIYTLYYYYYHDTLVKPSCVVR